MRKTSKKSVSKKAVAKKAPVAPIEQQPDARQQCDPCQWPKKDTVTGRFVPCGWREGVSLRGHIKSHKGRAGKAITVAQYEKRFPKANLGPPAYSPPPAQVEKFMKKNPNLKAHFESKGETIEHDQPASAPEMPQATDERVQARFLELFRLVNHDPTAKQFCMQAARDEMRLEEINTQLDAQLRCNKPDGNLVKALRQTMSDITEALQDIFKHLDLTVAARRKANQLGDTTTVAQLISNYANTRRKWSRERNEMFDEQITDSRNRQGERIKRRILDQVPQLPGENANNKGDLKNDSDYNAAIHEIGESIRGL